MGAPLFAAPSDATLRQCFDWARARSGELKARAEDAVQSRARARAALGSAAPHLDWSWTKTRQDPEGVEVLEGRGFSGFVEKDQIDSKFSLRQPLFSGFREFSAYSAFRRETARDDLLLERASRALYRETAEAFYAVLENEAERANVRSALSLAEDRVKDLAGFKRLGKARESEVFTAQARAAALRAQLHRVEARISSSRAALSLLTGQDLLALPLSDDLPMPPPVPALAVSLAAAQERSDLRAQREELAARRKRVRFARGAWWPNADVTGNYYTRRPAFMDEISWDVALNVNVPIFQGGTAAARVREAASARRQAEASLEDLQLKVENEVRVLHSELAAAVQEAEALEEAARAAQRSYDALRREYSLGLVTNLEVLEALDFLLAQKTSRDAVGFSAKRLSIRLQVATEAAR